MAKLIVSDDGNLLLSDRGLSVFRVPRVIFDELTGIEVENHDSASRQRFWVKRSTLADSLPITFYCQEPPSVSPARSEAEREFGLVERTG